MFKATAPLSPLSVNKYTHEHNFQFPEYVKQLRTFGVHVLLNYLYVRFLKPTT